MADRDRERVETALRERVDPVRLQRHLIRFSTLFRDSGSPDERAAAEYVRDTLAGYGVAAQILTFPSLISWPLAGRLALLDGAGREVEEIPVRTRSFGAPTPPGGIEAELVYVPFAAPEPGAMIFSHRAVAGDYTGLDVAGKVVITMDGGPDGIRRAQEQGAAGHIHIWPSDEAVIHEMIGTSVWGTPTPESARRLPAIPALGVTNADGMRLAERCRAGTVRVRLAGDVRTAWMEVPLVAADIPGRRPDRFLLVGAHLDSWYEGVTDNATGDACLIELARVFHAQRADLTYGLRFCWWPGHSTGRYSGSTWYADTHFAELRAGCLGYLNTDSPGVRETTEWDCRYNMGEVEHITAAVVGALSGQEPHVRRPLKAGDQSFLGVGLPSLGAYRMLAVDHPDRKAVGGSGGAYWWHSPEDTLDKADARILADDTRIYATMAARLVLPELHPYNFVPSAQDFAEHLAALQEAAGRHLDLSDTLAAARELRAGAERLAAVTGGPLDAGQVERCNRAMLALSRLLNPALFTIDGPYEFDPALQLPVLPGLASLRELAALDPASNDYQFLLTKLRRQRNRIHDALLQASGLLSETLAAV
ncbi:MAG TPA: M28 family peptidase [Thermomicrobiales bacterium]|nr:M28 family peptidase [Thermomicrobiales bacterium]